MMLGQNALRNDPKDNAGIKAEFAEAVRRVKVARQQARERKRRQKLGVGREVKLDAKGKPVGWSLIVMRTDPPTYKLASPSWKGEIVGLAVDDLQTRGRIQKRAMEQRGALWVPPYFAKTWFGQDTKEGYAKGVAELLMPHATTEEASDDVKRPAIILDRVREAIAGIVGHRRVKDAEEKVSPERLPCRDHAGKLWFTFTQLFDAVAQSADRPTRAEIHAALTTLDVENARVGSGNNARKCKVLPLTAAPERGVRQCGET